MQLYVKECEKFKEVPRCGDSRCKLKDNGSENDNGVTKKGVHVKVMWYLLIIQRFKRFFANVSDAKNTRWHTNERVCDGKNFHVAASS